MCVCACKSFVCMVTGDNLQTARAIARKCVSGYGFQTWFWFRGPSRASSLFPGSGSGLGDADLADVRVVTGDNLRAIARKYTIFLFLVTLEPRVE